jgi:peptide/nickel transport system ATP-binding protein
VPRVTSKNERLKAIPGQPPSLINLPVGCPFAPRCEYKQHSSEAGCNTTKPALIGTSATHRSRCHIPEALRHDLFAKELKELQS